MNKLIIYFYLFVTFGCFSQELMNYHIEPSASNDAVDLYTLVYRSSFSSFDGYSIDNIDNNITVTLCYLNTSATTETFDFQNFEINLPNGYSNYTLNIEVYGDNDALPPCSLDILVDTGSITFEYPYNPTATTYIPDNVFEDYLEDLGFGDDVIYNDLVYTHRIVNMTNLFMNDVTGNIVSMDGIEDFIALKDLRCGGHQITSLDISNNLYLEWLWCYNNPINQLNVSNNINLTWLWAWEMNLTDLDITNNVNLERLDVRENNLNTIDLSQNINIKYLSLSSNQFENIDVTNNVLLEELLCGYNLLSSLNVTNNSNLLVLAFNHNNISSIDLLNNNLLEWLFCDNNLLTEINITILNNLVFFDCSYNQIISIDLSSNPQLELVSVYNNNLTLLNLKNGNNSNIETLVALDNDDLYCIDVDDEDAANNGEFPYSEWSVDAQVVYSEDCSLGIEDVLMAQITMYPNPVQDVLNIENSSGFTIQSIKLYDVLGRLVLHLPANKLGESNSISQLDVSSLSSGLLFINLETDKGLLIKKILKN